jgi:pyruvate, orthophosphate dikinase
MAWIHALSAGTGADAEVIGGKARGLVTLLRLGLPVPPGFVITTEACRAFLRDGRPPEGFTGELAAAVGALEAATGRRFGGPERPLTVSVRSGGAVSMPGMMNTVLNLGLTRAATAGLAAETGDARFARDCRRRYLAGYAAAVLGEGAAGAAAGSGGGDAAEELERLIRERTGTPVPDDAAGQLEHAVAAVFSSWHTPRAHTYRELRGLPHDAGTAVIVQAMVFGNRDARSGTGVVFSRHPGTGAPGAFGEVLFGGQGEEVVGGGAETSPLGALAGREPGVMASLLAALERMERHCRDACYAEFTFERGGLSVLQMRPGGFTGRAAVRVAVELAEEGTIRREEALLRISPAELGRARVSGIDPADRGEVLLRGIGASPGAASGRVATTAEAAVRMAGAGPVILVRPETSPVDLRGLAAAAGVLTARGGPASHAAVVARSLGKPAVVGAAALDFGRSREAGGYAGEGGVPVRIGGRPLPEGALITVDGTGGEVVAGRARVVVDAGGPWPGRLLGWADTVAGTGTTAGRSGAERLRAARAVLGVREPAPDGA